MLHNFKESKIFWPLRSKSLRCHGSPPRNCQSTALPCCILLGVVAQSFKPVKPLSQQLPTFLLFRDRHSLAQRSCITHDYLGDCQQSSNFAWWTTHDGLTLLGVVASICTSLPTWTQQHPTLLAQQCWELLCLFAHSLRFTAFSLRSDQICLYCTKQNTILLYFARQNIMTY